MNHYDELLKLVESLKEDFSKFYEKDVNSAGSRVRKGMQELKEKAQAVRVDVQSIKNAKDTTAA